MAVYAKIKKNGDYCSHNFAHAVFGFREMGAEIIKYESLSNIYNLVTREDIVLDYIYSLLSIFEELYSTRTTKTFCNRSIYGIVLFGISKSFFNATFNFC